MDGLGLVNGGHVVTHQQLSREENGQPLLQMSFVVLSVSIFDNMFIHYLTRAVSSSTSDPEKSVQFDYVHCRGLSIVGACSENVLDQFCRQFFCCV